MNVSRIVPLIATKVAIAIQSSSPFIESSLTSIAIQNLQVVIVVISTSLAKDAESLSLMFSNLVISVYWFNQSGFSLTDASHSEKCELIYDLQELRKYLTCKFSKDEIHIICFDLGIDYEEFNDTKPMLVVDLLNHLLRKGKLDLLDQWLKREGYSTIAFSKSFSNNNRLQPLPSQGMILAINLFKENTHRMLDFNITPSPIKKIIFDFETNSKNGCVAKNI